MTLPTTSTDSEESQSTAGASSGNDVKTAARASNPALVSASIRDLIVHLTKGNGKQAGVLVAELTQTLETLSSTGAQPSGERLQLTIAAIGEAKLLMAEKDLWGAASAAREAAKEWRTNPASD